MSFPIFSLVQSFRSDFRVSRSFGVVVPFRCFCSERLFIYACTGYVQQVLFMS